MLHFDRETISHSRRKYIKSTSFRVCVFFFALFEIDCACANFKITFSSSILSCMIHFSSDVIIAAFQQATESSISGFTITSLFFFSFSFFNFIGYSNLPQISTVKSVLFWCGQQTCGILFFILHSVFSHHFTLNQHSK